jgi:hypothetical protein
MIDYGQIAEAGFATHETTIDPATIPGTGQSPVVSATQMNPYIPADANLATQVAPVIAPYTATMPHVTMGYDPNITAATPQKIPGVGHPETETWQPMGTAPVYVYGANNGPCAMSMMEYQGFLMAQGNTMVKQAENKRTMMVAGACGLGLAILIGFFIGKG